MVEGWRGHRVGGVEQYLELGKAYISQLCEIANNPQISVAYNHRSLLPSLMMKGNTIWDKP